MASSDVKLRELALDMKKAMAEAATGLPHLKIMHVCGTHEHEIGRYAIRKLLPANVELIAGPGCPVCITPASAIATVIKIANLEIKPIVCVYGDVIRVPITGGSLAKTKSDGADVRIVYGAREALRMAVENPDREVVFFSVGFETTAAPAASMFAKELPKNFSVYCCHRFVPTAVRVIAGLESNEIGGYLLPGHASVIVGAGAYDFLADEFKIPSAVAGFEPFNIISGLLSIIRQKAANTPTVANCYKRAVTREGNTSAMAAIDKVFERRDAAWRGIGSLPDTGLFLRDKYRQLDALARFGVDEEKAEDLLPGCSCHLIMMGKTTPERCPLFGKKCVPEDPKGPCMVGSEGTCKARYTYPEGDDE